MVSEFSLEGKNPPEYLWSGSVCIGNGRNGLLDGIRGIRGFSDGRDPKPSSSSHTSQEEDTKQTPAMEHAKRHTDAMLNKLLDRTGGFGGIADRTGGQHVSGGISACAIYAIDARRRRMITEETAALEKGFGSGQIEPGIDGDPSLARPIPQLVEPTTRTLAIRAPVRVLAVGRAGRTIPAGRQPFAGMQLISLTKLGQLLLLVRRSGRTRMGPVWAHF
jgi:hypothetical protein